MNAHTAAPRSARSQRQGWDTPPSLYEKLQPAPHQMAPEQVAAVQRRRLCGAMVQAVAEQGYGKVTVRRLHRLAGVSKHTLYDHFADERLGAKRRCLLAAIDGVLALAVEHATAHQRHGRGWRERLALTLGSLALDVARHPDAARVVLFEAYDPQAGALAALARGGERFEELLADCFQDLPSGEDPPPLIVKGILAGTLHIARTHLLAGREQELPRRAVDELATWACACCARAPLPPALSAAAPGSAVRGSLPVSTLAPERDESVCEERLSMLEACACIAVEQGYDSLRISAIERGARVPRGAFRRHFTGVRECFIGAYELLCGSALTHALAGGHGGGAWSSAGPRPMLAQLAGQLAVRPDLARLAFCELLAAGPAGVRSQTRLLEAFAHALARQAPPGRRPSPVVLGAGVGAVWGVAGHLSASGRARGLPANCQVLARLMAPVSGADCHPGTKLAPAA